MSKTLFSLTLLLFGAAQAAPLAEVLQQVEAQPAVKSLLLQIQETQLKQQAPGALPLFYLKGSLAYGQEMLQEQAGWSSDFGAGMAYGLLSGPQQQQLLVLENQRLLAELTGVRIVTLKSQLQLDQHQQKARLNVQEAEVQVRLLQLELQALEARQQLGAATALQVQNAQLGLSRAKLLLAQQQQVLHKALQDLQRAKWSPATDWTFLPLPPAGFVAAPAAEWQSRKTQLELAFRNQKLALESLPEFTLQGHYTQGSSSLNGSINQQLEATLEYGHSFQGAGEVNSWGIKLAARFNLDFTRGAQQNLGQQQLQLEQQQLAFQRQDRQLQVMDLWSQVQQATALVDLGKQLLDLSNQNLQLEKQRQQQGLVSELAVVQAEAALLKEQQNLFEAHKTLTDLTLNLWEATTWYPQNGL